MAARVVSVAFEGVEARRVDVEVQAVGGHRRLRRRRPGRQGGGRGTERVRAAFAGLGLALPPRRIVANLAPADLPKEGSHYDLPIALALMAAMGIIPPDALDGWAAIGELNLDGEIAPVAGALPAAMAAGALGLGLICPEACGPEAAWAGETAILAPRSLIAIVNHFRGTQVMGQPKPGPMLDGARGAGPQGRQGPGAGQAGAGDRRGRRPQPALRRPARARASRCWRSACPACCRRSRPRSCWRPRWSTRWPA